MLSIVLFVTAGILSKTDIYLRNVKPTWAGKAYISMIDLPEGVRFDNDEAVFDTGGIYTDAARNEKWYKLDHPEGLQAMYQNVLDDIESRLGTKVTLPSAQSSISPSGTSAPWTPDCWNTHMIKQMSACDATECLQRCASIKDQGPRVVCFNACSETASTCREQASADYRACIKARKSSQ